MGLQEEINAKSAEIRTDSYAMSIGELMSVYERKEIDIHPEFQRYYRWSNVQKSRLIESVLLNIPLPPIFVYQRPDGIWDVVDGLQRLSTFFEFAGILRDESNQILPALTLTKTKELPSLEDKLWESDNESKSFTPSQRLYIKRAKLDMKIILKDSGDKGKYELFQRLNTGGTALTHQEIRNCMLIMLNDEMYKWLRKLSRDLNFKESVIITDRALDEQYDMELALRFLVFRTAPLETISNIGDLSEYLTDRMVELAESNTFDYASEEEAFTQTFMILNSLLHDDSFRKYDNSRDRFLGPFLVSAYEIMALGLGYNYRPGYRLNHEQLMEKVQRIWANPDFVSSSGSGIRASTRIPRTIALGRELFSP